MAELVSGLTSYQVIDLYEHPFVAHPDLADDLEMHMYMRGILTEGI